MDEEIPQLAEEIPQLEEEVPALQFEDSGKKVPVTIITGFLGAGKVC